MFLALFCLLLAFMAFQFIFKFVLPIYRTTKQMRRNFRDMQERMNGQPASRPKQPAPPQEKPVGEYIDFEEVKEK